jgi:chaperonin GroES
VGVRDYNPRVAVNPFARVSGVYLKNLDFTDFHPESGSFERRGSHMKIRPLQDRVIVLRVDEEAKTAGGIIIPDTAKEKPQEGKIVAVGKGKVGEDGKVQPLDVKKGDRILFGKYAGTEIKLEGEDHLILREDDILGVLE